MKPLGKCPKCQQALPYLKYEQIEIKTDSGDLVDVGFSLICPSKSCHTIISSSFEMISGIDEICFLAKNIAKVSDDISGQVDDTYSEASSAAGGVRKLLIAAAATASENQKVSARKAGSRKKI
jgi:hypothetical protein